MTDTTVRITADVSGIGNSLETVISSLSDFQTLVNTTGQDLIQNTQASADALNDVNTGISNLNNSFQDTHEEIVRVTNSLGGLSSFNQQILSETQDQTRAVRDQTLVINQMGSEYNKVANAIHCCIQNNNKVQNHHTNLL